MILDYMQRFGRMGALYTDRASHFGNWRRPHGSVKALEARETEMTHSIIRVALEALGSELIIALSPQAKGRIERLFGTLQDRLIKEIRLAGISTLEAANQFLEERFIPFWNARFTVEAAEPTDAHRPIPEEVDLYPLFAETEARTIGNDFTIRYKNQHLQIEAHEAEAGMPKKRLTVERRLDGTTRYRFGERYLTLIPMSPSRPKHDRLRGTPAPSYLEIEPLGPILECPPGRSPAHEPLPSSARRKPLPKPAPNHPWRQYRVRFDSRSLQPNTDAPAALDPREKEPLCTSP